MASEAIPWHVIGQRRSIYWDKTVWLDLLAACQAGFRDSPWGGVEIGGILLGTRQGEDLTIDNFLPASCEHSLGPSFELSAADNRALAELIAEQQALGRVVVGWWHSVSYRTADLSAADIELSADYFAEPWQVSLVVRRSATEKAEPVLFVWQDQELVKAEFRANSAPGDEVEASKPTIDLYRASNYLSQPNVLSLSGDELSADGISLTDDQTDLPAAPPVTIREADASDSSKPTVPEIPIGMLGLVRLIGKGLLSSPEPMAGPRRYTLQFGAPSRPVATKPKSVPTSPIFRS